MCFYQLIFINSIMTFKKSLLHEVALDSKAIKVSRSEEIQLEQRDESMSFIRNFILGIPLTQLQETDDAVLIPGLDDLADIKKLAGIKE